MKKRVERAFLAFSLGNQVKCLIDNIFRTTKCILGGRYASLF